MVHALILVALILLTMKLKVPQDSVPGLVLNVLAEVVLSPPVSCRPSPCFRGDTDFDDAHVQKPLYDGVVVAGLVDC